MYLLIHPSILIAAYPPKDQVQGWNFYHVDFSALGFSEENAVSIGLSYHSDIIWMIISSSKLPVGEKQAKRVFCVLKETMFFK